MSNTIIHSEILSTGTNKFVTVADVKKHARIDFSDDDAYLATMIDAGIAKFENECGISIREKEIKTYISFDNTDKFKHLPLGGEIMEIQEVTDKDGIAVTDYEVKGTSFIQIRSDSETDLIITYVSGYDAISADMKVAIWNCILDMYEGRGIVEAGKISIWKEQAKKFKRFTV